MKKMIGIAAGALIFGLQMFAGLAYATNWYVNSATGDDGHAGTLSQPCKTINGCLNKSVQPGDTIHVETGNYSCFYVNKSGTAGSPITFLGGTNAVINSGTGCGNNGVYVQAGQHDVTVENFDISGFSAAGISATGGSAYNLNFSYNTIHDNGGGGVIVVGADCVSITHNTVYRNSFTAPNSTSGISIYELVSQPGCTALSDGFKNHISYNEGYENDNKFSNATDGNCIIVDDMRDIQHSPHVAYYGPTLVKGNYCHDNGGRGIHVFESDNVTVYNNTLTNNCTNAAVCSTTLSSAQGEINCNVCGGVSATYNTVTPSSNEYGVAYRNQSGSNNSADHNQLCITTLGDHYFDSSVGNIWGTHNTDGGC